MSKFTNAEVRGHKVHLYWCEWSRQFRCYSEDLNADDSPYGEGKSPELALADLDWQLEEIEDRQKAKEKNHDAG
jgi:hypothetical protein